MLKSIRTEQMELRCLEMGREEEANPETVAFERPGAEVRSKQEERYMTSKWVNKSWTGYRPRSG